MRVTLSSALVSLNVIPTHKLQRFCWETFFSLIIYYFLQRGLKKTHTIALQ